MDFNNLLFKIYNKNLRFFPLPLLLEVILMRKTISIRRLTEYGAVMKKKES